MFTDFELFLAGSMPSCESTSEDTVSLRHSGVSDPCSNRSSVSVQAECELDDDPFLSQIIARFDALLYMLQTIIRCVNFITVLCCVVLRSLL